MRSKVRLVLACMATICTIVLIFAAIWFAITYDITAIYLFILIATIVVIEIFLCIFTYSLYDDKYGKRKKK